MLCALSADRSNSKSDFCGKGPLFLERVTFDNFRLPLMQLTQPLKHSQPSNHYAQFGECRADRSVLP